MKKLIVLVNLLLAFVPLYAQDLIYTVSEELDGMKVPLDSILVENLMNGTRILFDNLPEYDYYQVNLSKMLAVQSGYNLILSSCQQIADY